MLDKLLTFVYEQKLFPQDRKIILAVSGGIDSMVLAHLFNKAEFNFAAAHCNFGLRGDESNGDQMLVESTARSYGVDCFIKKFDTEVYAKKHGISIQMSARNLRREWFRDLLSREGCEFIATAHHLNDSLETIIFNLTKGTGIAGLKGISPKIGNYVRPLMFASREMIATYAAENQISWREDKSNNSVKYQRNLIRHHVVPELKKINPALESTLANSLEKITAAERIYKKAIDSQIAKLIKSTDGGVRISKNKLRQVEEATLVLFEILRDFGFNFHQTKDILKCLNGQPGKTFFSPTHKLVSDRNFIFIHKSQTAPDFEFLIDAHAEQVELPDSTLTLEKTDVKHVEFNEDNSRVFVDYEKLKFPLKIKTWRHGDRFQPLGMKHKKKLSDFMIDEKIPLNLKEQVMVLFSEEKPVWVIGYRIDDRYKITKNTVNALSICKNNRDDQPV